jgi:hypothetical protein
LRLAVSLTTSLSSCNRVMSRNEARRLQYEGDQIPLLEAIDLRFS